MDDFTALVASCKFVSDFSRSAAFGLDLFEQCIRIVKRLLQESRVLSSETAPSPSANVCWASETSRLQLLLGGIDLLLFLALRYGFGGSCHSFWHCSRAEAVNARLLLADLLREAVGAI
ncbi:MAG: hypothetical protein ACLUA4_01390 [Bifidobacterium sp.]